MKRKLITVVIALFVVTATVSATHTSDSFQHSNGQILEDWDDGSFTNEWEFSLAAGPNSVAGPVQTVNLTAPYGMQITTDHDGTDTSTTSRIFVNDSQALNYSDGDSISQVTWVRSDINGLNQIRDNMIAGIWTVNENGLNNRVATWRYSNQDNFVYEVCDNSGCDFAGGFGGDNFQIDDTEWHRVEIQVDTTFDTPRLILTMDNQEIENTSVDMSPLSDGVNVTMVNQMSVCVGANPEVCSSQESMFTDQVVLEVSETATIDTYSISGRVIDGNTGDGINNSDVDLIGEGSSTTTNSTGYYEFTNLVNGSYTIEATKNQYSTENIEIEVNGSNVENADIELFPETLELDIRNFMDHGTTQDYEVFFTNSSRHDVTDQATVTSSNTSIITVDQSAHTLTATSNRQINEEVTINATYQGHSAEENVTVANQTIDNIDKMPGVQFVPTFLGTEVGDGPLFSIAYGIGSEIQFIFYSIIIATALAALSRNALIGVGSLEALLIFSWLFGSVSLGIVLAGWVFLAFALFVIRDPFAMNRDTIVMENE